MGTFLLGLAVVTFAGVFLVLKLNDPQATALEKRQAIFFVVAGGALAALGGFELLAGRAL